MPTRQARPFLLRLCRCRASAAAQLIFSPQRQVAADAGTPEFVEPVVGDHEHVGREGLVGASGWITLDAADGQPSLRTQITKPYLQRIED